MSLILKTFAILTAVPTIYFGVTLSTILMPPPVQPVAPVLSTQYVTKADMKNLTYSGNWWDCARDCAEFGPYLCKDHPYAFEPQRLLCEERLQ